MLFTWETMINSRVTFLNYLDMSTFVHTGYLYLNLYDDQNNNLDNMIKLAHKYYPMTILVFPLKSFWTILCLINHSVLDFSRDSTAG